MGTPEDTATLAFEEEIEAEVVRLHVVSGPDPRANHEFANRAITVGSGPNAEFRIADPTMSRLHCRLAHQGAGVVLTDAGSKNGCWLPAVQIESARLHSGARVRLGSTVIGIELARGKARQSTWKGGHQLGGLVGASASAHLLFAKLARLALGDETVLLRGETGSGKELCARVLHDHGARRAGPFVVLDAGALSQQLADLELFGHERGAFTGAERDRVGAFERAHGGTVFIDEIGEIPIEIQPKLLRALEDRTVQRLGGSQRIPVDVRVVAATHRNLERMVNDGAFREDLYYRLAVVEVEIPPLRARGDDVVLIARALASQLYPTDPRVADRVELALADRAGHAWPGNVRELRTFVRRVGALGDAGPPPLDAEALPHVRMDLPYPESKREWERTFDRLYLRRAIEEAGGNVTEAARRAGISRGYVYRILGRAGGPADDDGEP